MNEEIQLEFLKDIIKDLCENNNVNYCDYTSLKNHIKETMEMAFDNVSYDLIEFNLSKLMRLKCEFNDNFNGKVI